MSENDLAKSLEQARQTLAALRKWLGNTATSEISPEIESTLGKVAKAVFAKDPEGRYVMMNPRELASLAERCRKSWARTAKDCLKPE